MSDEISKPQLRQLPDEAYVLPREMTPAIRNVLRLLPWWTMVVSSVLERAAISAPKVLEDQQADALFFLLPYAIAYGDDWWLHANNALNDLQAQSEPQP